MDIKTTEKIYWFQVKDNVVSDIMECEYDFLSESTKTKLESIVGADSNGIFTFHLDSYLSEAIAYSKNHNNLHFFRNGLIFWKEKNDTK